MSTQITEWLEVIAKILLLCWLFGFVLLFIWLAAFMSGAVYKLHGPLMDLSAHEFLLPISVLLLTPLVRPVTWRRLLLTYVIPLAPLVLLWDGVVSVLRCYRPEELRAMADELVGVPYHWETGSYWHRTAPVTYMIGYPIEESAEDPRREEN